MHREKEQIGLKKEETSSRRWAVGPHHDRHWPAARAATQRLSTAISNPMTISVVSFRVFYSPLLIPI